MIHLRLFEHRAPLRAAIALARAKLSLAAHGTLSWIALACWTLLWWISAWYASTLLSASAIDFFIALGRDLRLEYTGSQTLNAMAAATLILVGALSFTAIIAGICARKAAAEEFAFSAAETIRYAGQAFHSAAERSELTATTPGSKAERPAKRL